MVSQDDLRRLTAARWLIPLMAQISTGKGARFAEMLARLGLSRGMLSASLAQLQEAGWVARNPGHGHPLRPEYVPTEAGAAIGAFCSRIMDERARLGLEPTDLPRWSLPVIGRLDDEPSRFSALQTALRPVTPRALSLTLKQMLTTRLVSRALADEFPPIAIYGLTDRGQRLAEAMRA